MNRTLVMVDQDGASNVGHYMAYNRRLAAVFQGEGWKVEVVCSRSMAPRVLQSNPAYQPVFTISSQDVHDLYGNGIVSQVVETEFFEFFSALAVQDHLPIYVYVYCGSLELSRIFRHFLGAGLPIRAHLNLFHNTMDPVHTEAFLGRWSEHLRWLDTHRSDLWVTAPTEQWQADLEKVMGVRLPVAVHPSTTVDDADFERVRNRPAPPAPPPFRVLFPAALRPGKGGDLTLQTLSTIVKAGDRLPWTCLVRNTGRSDAALTELAVRASKTIELVSGELTDEQFAAMLGAGHVAVIPYLPSEFARRTSGLLIDALYFGLPVVVMDKTWLADLVRHYACGAVVESEEPASLLAAIETVTRDYGRFRERVRVAAADYFQKHSWKALARSILQPWQQQGDVTATGLDRAEWQARALGWYRARDQRLRQWYHERRDLLVNLKLGTFYSLLTRLRARGLRRFALFGAGLHTRKLLATLMMPEGMDLVCILDDAPQTDAIAGVPVLKPGSAVSSTIQAIVVSSDSVEEKLYRRALQLNLAPVFTLYGKFEELDSGVLAPDRGAGPR